MDDAFDAFRTISTYVPAFLLQRLAAGQVDSLEGWQESIDATMLFADVSGFTRMSETLARLGKEGAEELTRVLNAYFDVMIDIVRAHGGFIVKFTGDAMTCQFPGGESGVELATRCALKMQRGLERFRDVDTKAGSFSLRMKIGISGGRVLFLSVGRVDRGLEYVLVGPALDRMVEAEHHARADEVIVDGRGDIVSSGTWEALGFASQGVDDGFWRIVDEGPRPRVVPALPADVQWGPKNTDDLTAIEIEEISRRLIPYIPPNIYQQIAGGYSHFVGEHRRVVSLFVNFTGVDYGSKTDIGEQLQTYYVMMQEIVQRHGGRLNRMITGDKGNVLHVIFGAPVAHEDNEARAARCALSMRQATIANDALSFVEDQRVGIASGYVFAGNVGSAQRQEYTVMGDVVNLSARLMQAAVPGQILVDAQTVRSLVDDFELEAMEAIRVKGKEAPVSVWGLLGVVGDNPSTWRPDSAELWLRSFPLVGRDQELALVADVLKHVVAGSGQVMVINGQAGVGKSRFVAELIRMADETGLVGFVGNCFSYGTHTPYLPWIQLFRAFFGFVDEDSDSWSSKIVRRMAETTPPLRDWAPLMAQLIGLPIPDNALTATLGGELRKQRLFDVVLTLLRDEARRAPLLLILEDLHWSDAISLEMLRYIARNISGSRILLVAVHRPAIDLSDLGDLGHAAQIDLNDLPPEDALRLAKAKLGTDELPDTLRELILRGDERVNPFFVEEVLNTLIDREYVVRSPDGAGYRLTGDLSEVEIPDSIQALVMSRIDRLDEASKLTVKVASVIGRTFQEDVLRAVYPVPISDSRLRTNLERLSTLDLTPLDKPAPDWEYIFRHVITQEVAYESLLYAHRRDLHHRTGTYLEQKHHDHLEEWYELLAFHYRQSDDNVRSWPYLVKAGHKARSRYANEAAISYYEMALSDPPEGAEVMEVRESLADVHHLLGHYEAARDIYQIALDEALDAHRTDVLRRKIAKTLALQGEYEGALQILQEIKKDLRRTNDNLELARVNNDLSWIGLQRGEYDDALDWCLEGLSLIRSPGEDDSDHVLSLRSEMLHSLGSIYGRMGEYDRAIDCFRQSIADAEAREDLYSAGRSYVNIAVVYWRRGEFDRVETYLTESLRIFERIGYAHGQAMCHNNLGALYYTLGTYDQAVDHYHESLQMRREIGDAQGIADVYNNLGEVYHALSDGRQARHYLEEAVDMLIGLGDRATLVDTYRSLAEVELSLDDPSSAVQYGHRSLDLARSIDNPEYVGASARALGRIYREAGDLAASSRYLRQSLEILSTTENRLELAQSHAQLGRTLLDDSVEAARQEFKAAMELFASLGLDDEVAELRAILESNSA